MTGGGAGLFSELFKLSWCLVDSFGRLRMVQGIVVVDIAEPRITLHACL